ncbi:MAG TPA: Type 1 glutamine amidotransferase-like domain-containing protein [Thermoanaerobaculia bacterium]|nr:Type 1 glutamine amidotransferase-like domain-containing protein [Thermoanaerobaculia bacterium]
MALRCTGAILIRCNAAKKGGGLLLLTLFLFSLPLHAELTRFDTGNPADVAPKLHGPILHLAGGGGDVDAAYQEVIDRIRGCNDCDTKVDVVVLRASGEDGYNDYLYEMRGVDSVTTFVITDRGSAMREDVLTAVNNAEYIFFAGGDQCNYVRYFNAGPLEERVRAVYARGGAIGGTSAGMAIMGKSTYDACTDESAQSKLALADPYNHEISFTTDFFDWRFMDDVITDTHFAQRDRMGRLFAFIARQLQELNRDSFLGIAANERTAVLVDERGLATVVGEGPAYFVLGDHVPERVLPKQPMTYCGFKIWRAPSGLAFDLARRPRTGFTTVDVVNGVIVQNPY